MNLRPARLGVLLVAVVALMATTTPPASASTVKLIVFTANLNTDKGLGYPCTTNKATCPPAFTTTSKTGPKGELELNITTTGGLHAGYLMTTTNCMKTSVSTPDKVTPKDGVGLCLMMSTGVIWGWCGLAEMRGVLTLVNFTGTKPTIEMEVKGVDIVGNFFIRGGGPQTNIYLAGRIAAAPQQTGGGSCMTKTGTAYTLLGIGLYKTLT